MWIKCFPKFHIYPTIWLNAGRYRNSLLDNSCREIRLRIQIAQEHSRGICSVGSTYLSSSFCVSQKSKTAFFIFFVNEMWPKPIKAMIKMIIIKLQILCEHIDHWALTTGPPQWPPSKRFIYRIMHYYMLLAAAAAGAGHSNSSRHQQYQQYQQQSNICDGSLWIEPDGAANQPRGQHEREGEKEQCTVVFCFNLPTVARDHINSLRCASAKWTEMYKNAS